MSAAVRSWKGLAACVAVLGAVVLAVLIIEAAPDGSRPASRPSDLPTFRLEADHPTYANVGSASADADLIVRGTVLSHTTEAGVSPGVDGLGDPLPPLPHTNHVVEVLEVVKGGVAVGTTIVVSLAGGTTEEGQFILDGAPEIHDGDTAFFFLDDGGDGRYYPLAGGAAVAHQKPDGSFALPQDATGADPVIFTEVDQPPDGNGNTGGSPALVPAAAAAAPVTGKPPLRCRKGFRKRMVKGKRKCVRVKKHRRHKGGKAKHGPSRLP
jgi:hypothetical protein